MAAPICPAPSPVLTPPPSGPLQKFKELEDTHIDDSHILMSRSRIHVCRRSLCPPRGTSSLGPPHTCPGCKPGRSLPVHVPRPPPFSSLSPSLGPCPRVPGTSHPSHRPFPSLGAGLHPRAGTLSLKRAPTCTMSLGLYASLAHEPCESRATCYWLLDCWVLQRWLLPLPFPLSTPSR